MLILLSTQVMRPPRPQWVLTVKSEGLYLEGTTRTRMRITTDEHSSITKIIRLTQITIRHEGETPEMIQFRDSRQII
jgi:hypothetical protein